jgi:DNA-binding CsgD family transcriptional regulator
VWQTAYEQHYAALNVWIKTAPEMYQTGLVGTSHQAVGDSDLRRTEFYNDYLKPQDYFYSYGGTIEKSKALLSYLTAMRPAKAGGFGPREIELLEFLMPHMDCALKIHSKISGLETRALAADSALDAFPCGVLMLDSRGRLLFMNRNAQSLLAQQDGLEWTAGALVASEQGSSARLRARLAAALQTAAGNGVLPGSRFSILRPSLRRAYEVLIAPLPSPARAQPEANASVLIFLTDPDSQPVPSADALRQFYSLTPAEARMAVALVQGRSVEEAAEEFSVSVHTARTQVKSIFAKTQTRSQSELMRLLMSSLARIEFLDA